MGVRTSHKPFKLLIAEQAPPAKPTISGILPALELPEADIRLDVTKATADGLLESLTHGHFDCAIVDTALPDLDPEHVIRRLRDLRLDLPLVFVCDGGDPRIAHLRRLGADCLPRDEVSSDRLSSTIWNAVRFRHAVERAAQSRAIRVSAGLDPLTKLRSRGEFFSRLEEAISMATRERKQLGLMLMDLNHFSEVNKTLGHKAGDMLLEEVAGRLHTIFRASDLVARVGDDEFAVLLQTGAALSGSVTTAGKLLRAMQEPFMVDDNRFPIGVSIGIALFPAHGQDAGTLIQHSELAMRSAKRDANGFVVYSGDSESHNLPQLSMANDLRNAIANDQLALHFQPVVRMDEGRIHGVEALLRWRHPKHGNVPPDVFIPLAEQTGSIETLTHWVLNRALEQWRHWQQAGLNLQVAVNLSALTLHNLEFPGLLRAILDKWQVSRNSLILEITESAIVSDAVRAAHTVDRLHDLGVDIAIDDFGSGYSSLAHIRKLSVSDLKIDKSYVLNMTTVPDDLVIVRTLIELGHNLGLKVVAEGVEDVETWSLLQSLNCDFAQGYYMAKPMDTDAIAKWLEDSPWSGSASSKVHAIR